MPYSRISRVLNGLRNHHFAVFDLATFLGAPLLALLIRSEGTANFSDYFPGMYYYVLI